MTRQEFEDSIKELTEEFSIYGISFITGIDDDGEKWYELPKDERSRNVAILLSEKFRLQNLLSANSFSSNKDKINALNEFFAIKRKLTSYKVVK